jgi:hypothetical protein
MSAMLVVVPCWSARATSSVLQRSVIFSCRLRPDAGWQPSGRTPGRIWVEVGHLEGRARLKRCSPASRAASGEQEEVNHERNDIRRR